MAARSHDKQTARPGSRSLPGASDFAGDSPRKIVMPRLAHVVEGRRVFTQLVVFDNLLLAAYDLTRGERSARVEEVLAPFPRSPPSATNARHVVRRPAANPGGGAGPGRRLCPLMLDEPSVGLSPVLVDRVLVMGAAAAQGRDCSTARRAIDREGAGRLPIASMRSPAGRLRRKPEPATPICCSTGAGLFGNRRAHAGIRLIPQRVA
jgi:hypothetical protein